MITSSTIIAFAIGAAACLALQGSYALGRWLLGLSSARQRAEALRDEALKKCNQAEQALRLAECSLAAEGRPLVTGYSIAGSACETPGQDKPKVTARRIER